MNLSELVFLAKRVVSQTDLNFSKTGARDVFYGAFVF